MTDPLTRMDEFISSNQLINDDDCLLMTVSGGMDSMFLLNYLVIKKYKIAVAHCNFGLRGKESDEDEQLVQSWCQANTITFHSKKFETEKFAVEWGISIQMAARDLRYKWFDELCGSEKYHKIVTAHHKTDNAETILLNLIRGTGLKGLQGIQAISGNKIRPLLCLTRQEINDLVVELKVNYREDSSNKSDKYYRNKLRHHILPILKEINPSFENTLQDNVHIVSQANGFIRHYLETIRVQIVKVEKDATYIDVNSLLNFPEPAFILYSLLSDYGFNASTVRNIHNALGGLTGKQFFSATHRVISDRGQLILEPLHNRSFQTWIVTNETGFIETQYHRWYFEKLTGEYEPSEFAKVALLDLDKIAFPLALRPWQSGDKLKPLGMKGHKKVSDILIDKKLSIAEKEKVYVVLSDSEIIWVGGLVIHEDFKLNPGTRNILRIRIEPNF